tara:strand:- start:369 stop:542 length:174 start_codon:yes stop_codon:yes gene_type:complete
MAETKKISKKNNKKPAKPASKNIKYKITKQNGNVMYRENLGEYVKIYESKGYKVEEI